MKSVCTLQKGANCFSRLRTKFIKWYVPGTVTYQHILVYDSKVYDSKGMYQVYTFSLKYVPQAGIYSVHTWGKKYVPGSYLRYIQWLEAKSTMPVYQPEVYTPTCRFMSVPYYSMVHTRYKPVCTRNTNVQDSRLGWWRQQSGQCIYITNMQNMNPALFCILIWGFAYYLAYYCRYKQNNMQNMQNNMQKNSAGFIFCIFCILQYAK